MPVDRGKLSAAEDVLARILTEAVVEDVFAGLSEGLWLAVRCDSEIEQEKLAGHLRTSGLEVILVARAA